MPPVFSTNLRDLSDNWHCIQARALAVLWGKCKARADVQPSQNGLPDQQAQATRSTVKKRSLEDLQEDCPEISSEEDRANTLGNGLAMLAAEGMSAR